MARTLYYVLTIVACVLHAVRSSRTEKTVQDPVQRIAQMEEHRSSIRVSFKVADDSHSSHDERSRQNHTAVDARLRGRRWLAHGHVSRLSRQPIGASSKTGEELVEQPLMTWRRAKLDSGAVVFFVFSLVHRIR